MKVTEDEIELNADGHKVKNVKNDGKLTDYSGDQSEEEQGNKSGLNIRIGNDSTVHYAEVILDNNLMIDITNLTFSSIGRTVGRNLDKKVEANLDIAIFRKMSDVVNDRALETLSECDWMDMGVGIYTRDGQVEICCTEDTANEGLCRHRDVGRILIKSSVYNGYYKHLSLPADDDFVRNIKSAKFQVGDAGTYVMLFATCNDGGRDVHVEGNLPLELASVVAPASLEKCCSGPDCDDNDEDDFSASDEENKFSLDIGADSGTVKFAKIYLEADTLFDIGDLTFTSRVSNTSLEEINSDELTLIDVAIFPFLDEEDSTIGTECSWTELGLGDLNEKGGVELCCTDDAYNSGLCSSRELDRLIRKKSVFNGHYNWLSLPADDDFEAHVMKHEYSPVESGTYIIVFATCNKDFGRSIHVEGNVALDMEAFLTADLEKCYFESSNNEGEEEHANDADDADGVDDVEDEHEYPSRDDDEVFFADMDFRFRLEPDTGVLKYVEMDVENPDNIDLSDLSFWSDDRESFMTGASKNDKTTFTNIDITFIPLPKSVDHSKLESSCSLVEVGIGAATPEGEIRWCCTGDAYGYYGLCGGKDYGSVIIDNSLLPGVTKRQVGVPPTRNSVAQLNDQDSSVSTAERGRYLVLFSNCNSGGKEVFVTGKMGWENNADELNSLSDLHDKESTCCQHFEDATCSNDTATGPSDTLDINLKPDPNVVHSVAISMMGADKMDLSKLSFWTDVQTVNTVHKGENTKIDVAVFSLPDTNSSLSCDWVELGIGAKSPEGEIHWCCNNVSLAMGLCEKSAIDRLIYNRSTYKGYRRQLEFPAIGEFVEIIHQGEIDASQSEHYIAVFANCDADARTISVSGLFSEEDELSTLSLTCEHPTQEIDAMLYIMVSVFFLLVTWISICSVKRKLQDLKRKQEFNSIYSDKSYPSLELVLA